MGGSTYHDEDRLNREGQVWVYHFVDGTDRVCLITWSEVGPDSTCHSMLNLDFPSRPDKVGDWDITFEGSLIRHWSRVA